MADKLKRKRKQGHTRSIPALERRSHLSADQFASWILAARPFTILDWWPDGKPAADWTTLSSIRSMLGEAADRRVDVACTAPGSQYAGDAR